MYTANSNSTANHPRPLSPFPPTIQPNPPQDDAIEVLRDSRHWEVRLQHEFIITWAKLLHPISFLVFTILEMKANWSKGATHKQTRGYLTKHLIMAIARCSLTTVDLALLELHTWDLIRYVQPDADLRRRSGRSSNIWLNEKARPCLGAKRLTQAELKSLKSNVGAPTLHQTSAQPTLETSVGPTLETGVRGTPETKGGPTLETGVPNTSITSNSRGEDRQTSSPSANLVPSHVTTTTVTISHDLTPLRQAAGFFVDDRAVKDLWDRAVREAPDVTVDEVRSCMASKGVQISNSPSTRNPVALLVVAVPNAIRDGWLQAFRQWSMPAASEDPQSPTLSTLEATEWLEYARGAAPSPLTGKRRDEDASQGVKRTEKAMIAWATSTLNVKE